MMHFIHKWRKKWRFAPDSMIRDQH